MTVTNDQDQNNTGKSSKANNSNNADSSNGVAKSTRKSDKTKDHTSNSTSHKCRCAASSTKSPNSRTASAATSIGNCSATNTSLLRNLKDLPVREYEKLPPTPPISLHKTNASVADANPLNEKVCSPKSASQNGTSTSAVECSLKQKKDPIHGTAKYSKATVADDVLILRIGGLDKCARRLSSLSINRDNEKMKIKTKHRTKTDPHPISSSQKLRELSSSGTLTSATTTIDSTHSTSKCNCSSCKSMSSSVSHSDNHNRTKSVGTQHDANNAYDPWVRQNSTQTTIDTKSSKTLNSSSKCVHTPKSANSNAKVIVITDDFKKKALNQEIFIDTKRKMLRYMKANKMTNSSRSLDDDNNEPDASATIDKQKAISKSVDNVSQLSTELDQLDNVGSVELIFISDEFLNKVSKPDVIILVSIIMVILGNRHISISIFIKTKQKT